MSRRGGITLVHVLIVIVIIGVLVALLSMFSSSATKRSRESASELTKGSRPSLTMNDAYSEAESRSRADGKSISGQPLGIMDRGVDQVVAIVPRKIVYQAEITLVVEDVSQTETKISELVKQYGGYVADSTVDRRQGKRLSGRWQVRIPVDKFDGFLEAVSKLGIAESRQQTAQDVTEEYVDLEARIATKKQLEARIVELLAKTSGQIKDIIEVERELARVRGEIEQMEGRLRYLTNRTDLTTVTIAVREERNYVPPEAPSFSARIQEAWNGSLTSFREYAEDSAVAAVYLLPWAVLVIAILIPLAWISIRSGARLKRHSTPETSSDKVLPS